MATAAPVYGAQYTEADYTDFEHTGPGTLAGRYLRSFWQPIYLSEDLERGWTKPITVMSEPFTLYRGEGGAAHLSAFRCAHRGTQLSSAWVEDDCLRCRYHGWKFDADGQCVEAPLEVPGFAARMSIRTYPPVREYLGLIFAYLGEGQPPALPHYSAFDHEGELELHTYGRACNLFNQLENDPGHAPFTHHRTGPRKLLPGGAFDLSRHQPDDLVSAERPWGITRYRERGVQCLMPNHLFSGDQRRPTLHFQLPIDDENYQSLQVELVPVTGEAARKRREARAAWLAEGGRWAHPELVEEILAGKIRLRDLDDNPPPVVMQRVQDGVTQIGQGKIRDRSQEHLGPSDTFVVLLRKVWERELRALAQGRPLTPWQPTDDMFPEPQSEPDPESFRWTRPTA